MCKTVASRVPVLGVKLYKECVHQLHAHPITDPTVILIQNSHSCEPFCRRCNTAIHSGILAADVAQSAIWMLTNLIREEYKWLKQQ
eukprot:1145712-Pelagomonas_calceolata.AAC.2